MLEDQITRAKSLLGEATKATGIVNARAMVKAAPGMEDINARSQDYEGATVLVRQAAAELAAAKQMSADLAGATEAKKKADSAMVPAAIEEALKALGQEVDAGKAAPNADISADLYKSLDTALADTRKLLDDGKPADAGNRLKAAADALLKARTAQSECGRVKSVHDALALRRDALLASTVPPADKLKGRTDPLVAALNEADEAGKAKDWNKAFKALNAADVAATTAEAALEARKLHDAARTAAFDKANLLADPAKGAALAMVAKADAAADTFNFAHAKRFLENAGAHLKGEEVKGLAKAAPLDLPAIEAAIGQMMDAVGGDELLTSPNASPMTQRNVRPAKPGPQQQKAKDGPALVDELVKGFDDTVPAEVIIAIAKKRFGIDLKISAMNNVGGKLRETVPNGSVVETPSRAAMTQRSDTARVLYNTLAMTPEQTMNNPSLKVVERTNAMAKTVNGNATAFVDGGGSYNAGTNKTVMKGRPNSGIPQNFGGTEMSTDGTGPQIRRPAPPPQPWDEKTTKEQAALAVFEPANETPVDYFEFANVHESGHGIDDRLGFMAKRLGNAAFGNWQVHGGKFGDVAGPVAKHYAKAGGVGDVAGALEQFVIDTMTGGTPEIPVVAPEKQAAVNDVCDKIKTEWFPNAKESANPWWSQGKTDKITMDDGRVYQESYPGQWTSYAASERAKGITGYQFRAPGEWFAELFSAYHHEKLKPGHPARKWLASLQL